MISDELPINKVPRGLEAPDEINMFSSSVQWIFQPSQCFVIIAILKMATTCREDGVQNTLLMVFAGDSAPHHFHFFLRRIVFILNFSVPWPTAGTSPCRHCSFSTHIDMLGWTTVGWAGHWWGSLDCHNHKCAAYQHLCPFMCMNHKQTYQLTYHHKCTAYQHLCMNMNHKQTYQLTYHHKCTAYQHLCHFMYMNHKQKYQLAYHHKCTAYQHLCHFNEDEPWRAYYQERYHTPHPTPPETAPTNTQRINTYVTSMKMNHRGPGRTSPCHQNQMNLHVKQHQRMRRMYNV